MLTFEEKFKKVKSLAEKWNKTLDLVLIDEPWGKLMAHWWYCRGREETYFTINLPNFGHDVSDDNFSQVNDRIYRTLGDALYHFALMSPCE